MSETKLGNVTKSGVQVVNFESFLDGSDKQAVADALFSSLRDTGFVYLVNHALPKDKMDGMFEWSKRFFSLSLETKQLAPHPPNGAHHRGYSGLGLEKVTQHIYDPAELARNRAKAADVKESFECGRENSEDMPNIWLPDDVFPGFKEVCLDFYWTCHEVELTILRALAIGLHLPETYLAASHTGQDNQLRLLHYPSVSIEALEQEKITRIGAHSDFGSITLLMQDKAGGLEIENPKQPGDFTPAPYIEGAIIVNAGDFLMRWSNDIIRSTIHRVHIPPDLTSKDGMIPARYSIPYFCSTDFSKVVDCLPGTWSHDRPKRYEAISAGEYIRRRLLVNY